MGRLQLEFRVSLGFQFRVSFRVSLGCQFRVSAKVSVKVSFSFFFQSVV